MINSKIIFALTLSLAGLFASGPVPASEPPALKARANVQVRGAFVTLGDLFENVGKKSNIAVFQAPAPGKTGYINAARLLDAVHNHGLDWKNSYALPRINIARQSRIISPADITASIRDKLIASAPGEDEDSSLSLRFNKRPASIHLPLGMNSGIKVGSVNYNRASGRFSAIINMPGNDNTQARQIYYTGRAVRTLEIPVLARPVNRGALIQVEDVTMKRVARDHLTRAPLRDISELIGMAATRNLRAGRALFKRDIEPPQIVKRGALVSIIFKSPGIILSTKGKALTGGALGETISVRNTRSKRTIQVSIIAPNTVSPRANTTTITRRIARAPAASKRGGSYE